MNNDIFDQQKYQTEIDDLKLKNSLLIKDVNILNNKIEIDDLKLKNSLLIKDVNILNNKIEEYELNIKKYEQKIENQNIEINHKTTKIEEYEFEFIKQENEYLKTLVNYYYL